MAMTGVFISTHLSAQVSKEKKEIQEERIIVQGKNGKPDMSIEIKDGEVFIDGKKVDSNGDDNGNKTVFKKKIIINGKDVTDDPEYNNFSFPFEGMDMQSSSKPMLGVNAKPTKNNDGAEIERVVPGSPAEKFGLQTGDVITKVKDKTILSPTDLVDAISNCEKGEKVDITFERNAKFMTKNVQLSDKNDMMTFRGQMPLGQDEFMQNFGKLFESFGNNDMNTMRPAINNSPKIGVSVEDRADGEGVYVSDVTDNSTAQKAGVQKGDVIIQFAGEKINNVDALLEAINSNQQKTKIDIDINRNGTSKKLQMTMPKNLKKREL